MLKPAEEFGSHTGERRAIPSRKFRKNMLKPAEEFGNHAGELGENSNDKLGVQC